MSNTFLNYPGKRQKIAESDPKVLARNLEFFLNNNRLFTLMAIPLIAGLLISLIVPFTRVELAPALIISLFSAGIFFVAMWGWRLGAKSLASIAVEHAMSAHIHAKGKDHLNKAQYASASKFELNKLEEAFLPNNPSEPTPGIKRLFKHIIEEAKDRRFDSSISVVQPFKEESNSGIFDVLNLQRTTLRLGILGTFTGLVLALASLDTSESNLAEQLDSILNSLYLSFSTSIAGLVAAIILAVGLMLIRKKQDAYFKSMEESVVTMHRLAYNAINRDNFVTEFNRINESLNSLENRIYDQAQNMERVEHRLKAQTTLIDEGISKITNARINFEDFLSKIGTTQTKFIEELTTTHTQFIDQVKRIARLANVGDLSQDLRASLLQAGERISEILQPALGDVSRTLADFSHASGEIQTDLRSQSNQVSTSISKIESLTEDQAKDLKDGIEKITSLGGKLQESISLLAGNLDEVNQQSASMYSEESMQKKGEAFFSKMETLVENQAKHIDDSINAFSSANQNLNSPLHELTDSVGKLVDEVKNLYDTAALEDKGKALEGHVKESSKKITALNKQLSNAIKKIEKIPNKLKKKAPANSRMQRIQTMINDLGKKALNKLPSSSESAEVASERKKAAKKPKGLPVKRNGSEKSQDMNSTSEEKIVEEKDGEQES